MTARRKDSRAQRICPAQRILEFLRAKHRPGYPATVPGGCSL